MPSIENLAKIGPLDDIKNSVKQTLNWLPGLLVLDAMIDSKKTSAATAASGVPNTPSETGSQAKNKKKKLMRTTGKTVSHIKKRAAIPSPLASAGGANTQTNQPLGQGNYKLKSKLQTAKMITGVRHKTTTAPIPSADKSTSECYEPFC